jgi:hypothetical protein
METQGGVIYSSQLIAPAALPPVPAGRTDWTTYRRVALKAGIYRVHSQPFEVMCTADLQGQLRARSEHFTAVICLSVQEPSSSL